MWRRRVRSKYVKSTPTCPHPFFALTSDFSRLVFFWFSGQTSAWPASDHFIYASSAPDHHMQTPHHLTLPWGYIPLQASSLSNECTLLTTDTVLCPSPDHPDNGYVSVTTTFVGDKANYYCNSGYRQSGSSSITCQLSGKWSGTPSTCISKL